MINTSDLLAYINTPDPSIPAQTASLISPEKAPEKMDDDFAALFGDGTLDTPPETIAAPPPDDWGLGVFDETPEANPEPSPEPAPRKRKRRTKAELSAAQEGLASSLPPVQEAQEEAEEPEENAPPPAGIEKTLEKILMQQEQILDLLLQASHKNTEVVNILGSGLLDGVVDTLGSGLSDLVTKLDALKK